jgi:predicted nucleic acid-binding protein
LADGVPVVLDACVLLNLLATERTDEIIEALSVRCIVSSAVCSEALYLRSDDPPSGKRPVSLEPLVSRGSLQVRHLQNEAEEAWYVRYSGDLDDGEAMSLAIAHACQYRLATDDRKARRVAAAAGVQLMSTAQILKSWAECRDVSPAVLQTALRLIEAAARFRPGDRDPLANWWSESRR